MEAQPATPRASLAEPLLVYALSALGIFLALLFGRGPLAEYRAGMIGALYIFLPVLVCRRRGLSQDSYAPLAAPSARDLLFALLLSLLTFPPFLLVSAELGLTPPFRALALPKNFWLLVLTQFLVIAVPEELFFRGYLQRRLDDIFPPRLRLFGVSLGLGLPLGALLFALAHFLSVQSPARLLTFFPGLAFGFLRAATGGIWAGAIYHALCNLYLELLIASS